MSPLPPGTIDLHVHTAPDVSVRGTDDLALARVGPPLGLAGAVLKCHHAPTGGRAWLVRQSAPGFHACGSVTLNRAVGGLNPAAVDALARLGEGVGRIVWLPTRDAANDMARKGRPGEPVAVTESGRPVPALVAVAERAAAHGLVLASGHLAPEETLAVFRAVVRALGPSGCRLLATHVTAAVTPFTPDQVGEALRLGALAELCARNLLERRADAAVPRPEAVAAAAALVRRFGAGSFVLSSDLGDPRYPAPAAGLAAIAAALSQKGVTDRMLETMMVRLPGTLAGAAAEAVR